MGLFNSRPEGVAIKPRDELREVRIGPGSTGVELNFDELVSNVFSSQVYLLDQAVNCFGITEEHPGFLIELLDSQSEVVQSENTDTECRYLRCARTHTRRTYRRNRPCWDGDDTDDIGVAW